MNRECLQLALLKKTHFITRLTFMASCAPEPINTCSAGDELCGAETKMFQALEMFSFSFITCWIGHNQSKHNHLQLHED